jgi:cellulose synthase/poly-beta-1,6-N-acetylglucosamine synthase-like glycosyltransferase/peptidoglycan/xylan/chitin deacetylase (PgdA/CDA1 family)
MRGAATTGPSARPARATTPWGHWVVLAIVLAGLAAALVVQRELGAGSAVGALPPAAGAFHFDETMAAAGLPSGGPIIARRGRRLAALAVRPMTVSLVFGGGSGPDVTPRIVAELRRLGVPATFFVTGSQAAADSRLTAAEAAAGDAVGMTGYTGVPLQDMPAWRLDAELAETQHELVRAGGRGTLLARPPGVSTEQQLTAGTADAVRRLADLGYVVVLPRRGAQAATSPDAVLRNVVPPAPAPISAAPGAPAPGAIPASWPPGLVIALSDAGRPGAAALHALPALAARFQAQGYRFTTIAAACGLRTGPVRTDALTAAGQDVLLAAVGASGVIVRLVNWSFLAAVVLIGSRILLLLTCGAWHELRDRRDRRDRRPWPVPVSVIIPAYNERAGIERCLRSMADSAHAELEIIVVDDGSTDGTAELAAGLGLPVTVITQPNAGKAAALNTGAARARHDVLVFADGDTVFEPETIPMLVAPLRDPWVGAVAGNVKVANRRGLLGLIQHCEYVLATSLDRRMYDVLDCMVTVPGAVGAFRRSALAEVGGVSVNTLAEDTDLTVAIGLAGWRVRYAPRARAWTEAPATVRQLWSQRHRWAYGMLQVLWKYRSAVLAPRGKRTLSWIGLPYLFAMGCVLPLVSPAADLYVLLDAWISPWHAVTIWAAFLGMQAVLTVPAFAVDRERLRDLWTLPVQLVFYRQLMYLVMIHSLATALTGVRLRWHKLARIGVARPALARHSDRAGVKAPGPGDRIDRAGTPADGVL